MIFRKKVFSLQGIVNEFWKVYQKLPEPERKIEHLWIMLLDVDFSIVDLRLIRTVTPENNEIKFNEIFAYPLYYNVPFFVLCHNHPSNWAEFSKEDKELYKNINEWAEKLGFRMLNFLVITPSGYYSAMKKETTVKKNFKFEPLKPHMTNLKTVAKILEEFKRKWFL